jgi:hypothetical protein
MYMKNFLATCFGRNTQYKNVLRRIIAIKLFEFKQDFIFIFNLLYHRIMFGIDRGGGLL